MAQNIYKPKSLSEISDDNTSVSIAFNFDRCGLLIHLYDLTTLSVKPKTISIIPSPSISPNRIHYKEKEIDQ